VLYVLGFSIDAIVLVVAIATISPDKMRQFGRNLVVLNMFSKKIIYKTGENKNGRTERALRFLPFYRFL